MKQIVVLSGKGGTGKSTITASLAVIVKNKIIVDADVDAANLNLLLQGKVKESGDFYTGKKAVIDKSNCVECGLCREHCTFSAISEDYVVNQMKCEGCGVCVYVCPQKTISFKDNIGGKWFYSETEFGDFYHAELTPGEENSGQLVTYLRRMAEDKARENKSNYILIDGSPGIGCPVISSVTGTDLALLVTEPTMSGFSDLKRIIDVVRHFGVSAAAIINRYDFNEEVSKKVEEYLKEENIPLLEKIPFASEFIEAHLKGIPPVLYRETKNTKKIFKIWEKIERFI